MKTFARLFLFLSALWLQAAVPAIDFDGSWTVAELETEQGPLPEDTRKALVVTVSGGKYSMEAGGQTVAKGKLAMDYSATPPVMTVTEEEGQNVGRGVRDSGGVEERTQSCFGDSEQSRQLRRGE